MRQPFTHPPLSRNGESTKYFTENNICVEYGDEFLDELVYKHVNAQNPLCGKEERFNRIFNVEDAQIITE